MRGINKERGSAIIYVFIGIILFAALALAFSRGMRESTGNVGQKTAKVRAAEILDYAQKIDRTVQKLILNRCSETELNFEYEFSGAAEYTNASAPVDGSCNVFAPTRMKAILPEQMGIPSTAFVIWPDGRLHFTADDMSVSGVGDDTFIDLTLHIQVDLDTCNEINQLVGVSVSAPPSPALAFNSTKFTGTFTAGVGREINAGASPLFGKDTGCYSNSGGGYFFYKTLIAK